MVNNVGFSGYNNFAQYSAKDIENITKYALGTNIVEPDENPLGGPTILIGGLIESFKVGQWAWKNRKDMPTAWAKEKQGFAKDYAYKKELLGNGGWKKAETYKTVWNNYSANMVNEAIPEGEKFSKLSAETKKAYEAARKAAEAAKTAKTAEAARASIKEANEALAKARNLAHIETTALEATTRWGKFSKGLGKYTGVTKLNGFMAKTATESPLMAKALKFGKGNGIFFAITGGLELFTQVIPAYSKLGAGKGTKQLMKSTAKTAASIGGWTAGMAAGAAIGSIIPGAGTVIGGAIGALCGFIGGTIGSWAAEKVTEKVVGKSELDIAKEKDAEEASLEAQNNPQAVQELMATAAQRLQQEGGESEDAKIAFTSMQNIANSQAYASANAKQKRNPQFQGSTNPFSQADYMNNDFMAMGAGLA